MNPSQVENITQPDILIVGGGSAGVAATAGAIKNGSSVVLIEKNAFPGGRATASQVGTICGLYLTGNLEGATYVCNGFPRDFAEKIKSKSHKRPLKNNDNLYYLPYDIEVFDSVCTEYLSNPLISVQYRSEVKNMNINNGTIESLCVDTGFETLLINPKCVIDTSGSVLSANTNPEIITDENYQAAARVFTVSGLKINDESTLNLAILRCIIKADNEFSIEQNPLPVSVIPGSLNEGNAKLKYSIPETISKNEVIQADLDHSSEKSIYNLFNFLCNNSEIFSNAKITSIAIETGIRTGPRNKGKYILSESDVLNATKFDDGIARGSWPIEIWKPGKKVELKFFNENDFYEIPSRCLMSDSIDNLFFAGKNISASENAIASARVIGTCLQTGFAAGALASGYCNNVSLQQSIQWIRKSLF